jgi:DNA-binding response OmpR family regulator
MRILIIDDDEQIRVLLQQMMEWAGFEVAAAENGKIAMRLQQQQPADLVITDLIMPEQEGLETISRLKKEYKGIKIIAISGGGRIGPEAYLPAAQELGADRIFSKPFDVQEVVDAVRDLLKTSSG